MMGMSRFSVWLPLIVSVPFSLVYRFIILIVFQATVSWGFIVAMNIWALVYVVYNLKDGRLIPFKELPKQAWVVALTAVILFATISYAW